MRSQPHSVATIRVINRQVFTIPFTLSFTYKVESTGIGLI